MTSAIGKVDEYVKEYLTFRGLSYTLRTLESELKNEKEKGFRVDKIVEQLQSYITNYDLSSLRDYWNFLNSRLFSRLEYQYIGSIRKMEIGLMKLYLVNAAQNKQHDKVRDFFDKMTDILQTQPEFKEWFAFPFVRAPEENSHFATYFTRQWHDTFLLSLHNLLSVILHSMPEPVLLNFEADLRQLSELQKENERLKQQIISLGETPDTSGAKVGTVWDRRQSDHNQMEMLYDFSSLGEDTVIQESSSKAPRKFPFPSSPLNIGKKSDRSASTSTPKKDNQIKMSSMPNRENKIKSSASKLLPVITRQVKKAKPLHVSNSAGNDLNLTSQNIASDAASNQKSGETSVAHRMKKFEATKQERRELLEGSSDQKQTKDDKLPVQKADTSIHRSISEPADRSGSRRFTTELKPGSLSVMSEDGPQQPVSSVPGYIGLSEDGTQQPLSSVPGYMGLSENTTELQSFPPINTPTEETPDTAVSVDEVAESNEKPFLLLSQDEFAEHRFAVSYAAFSNSGHYVASVDVDGVVKIWTCIPQICTASTVMSRAAFLSLEWASKSDRWLLLGNKASNIRLFDVKEMKSFYEATGDTNFPRVTGLCSNPASPMFVCSSCTDSVRSNLGPNQGQQRGKLSLWDLKTMKSDKLLPLDTGSGCTISTMMFNHNGQLLVTGGDDGQIRLFDVPQQKCISHWEAHEGDVRSVIFSADFNSFYSLGTDCKLKEWSVHKNGQMIREHGIHSGAVPSGLSTEGKETPSGKLLALDSDGAYLMMCGEQGASIHKKRRTGVLSHMMDVKNQSPSPLTTVDWSPNMDTKICLTGYQDGRLVVSTLLSQ